MKKAALLILASSAATSAGAQTLDHELPQVFTLSPTGVDMRSGKLVIEEVDLEIMGEKFVRGGAGLRFSRNPSADYFRAEYDSVPHNFNIGLRVSAPTSSYIANVYTGVQHSSFVLLSGNRWMPQGGEAFYTELINAGSTFSLLDASGGFYQFQTHPALNHSSYPNGLQVLQFYEAPNGERVNHSYDASGRLQTRQYSRGFGFRFEYDSVGNLVRVCARNLAHDTRPLTSPCGAGDRTVSYLHSLVSGKYRISRIDYPDGSFRNAHYHPNPTGEEYEFLRCFTVPNTDQCEVENWYGPQPGEHQGLTAPNQVRRQRMATGEEWTYRFNTTMLYENPQQPGEVRYTDGTMTDPTGHSVTVILQNGLIHNLSGLPGPTKFKHSGLRLSEYEFPEGNKITLQYDRHNIVQRMAVPKPGSSEVTLAQTATYPANRSGGYWPVGCDGPQKLCEKPITVTDGRGHVTDYTYDPAHGGVLTETGPAAANGARPSKRYSYVQRHAWIRSAGGGYVQAATPIWLLSDERHCRNSASSGSGCAVPSDLVVTSYEYENGNASTPSNLLLKGVAVTADGQTLRTCYGYDQWGQKISETRPLAGLGACP